MQHPIAAMIALFLSLISFAYWIWARQLFKRCEAGKGSERDAFLYKLFKAFYFERAAILAAVSLGAGFLVNVFLP